MASKAQMIKFNKKVEKIVLTLGGVPDSFYKWVIETKAGKLFISVHEPEASKLFSIFCCFDDVEMAKIILTPSNQINLNKYSGKFNFHYSSGDTCIEVFSFSLKEIL